MVEHPRLLVGRLADHHRPLELREIAPHRRARAGHEHVARLEDDVVRERVRDRRAAADLAAVAGGRAAVEGSGRGRAGRASSIAVVASSDRALRHLRLRRGRPRVLLEEPVREIPPLRLSRMSASSASDFTAICASTSGDADDLAPVSSESVGPW